MSSLKNIVIVGASGGIYAARALEKTLPKGHRIVLIEKNDYAWYHPATLRASTMPSAEDLAFQDLSKVFPSSSQHIVLSGTEVTHLAEKSVTISKEFEGSTTVSFEYAILVTGANHYAPSEPSDRSKEGAVEGLKKAMAGAKDAKSVLVVGGGPLGIEYVGEVKHQYPDKKVTLVSKSSSLISGFNPKMGKALEKTMKNKGVDLRMGASIDVPSDVPSATLLPSPRSFTVVPAEGSGDASPSEVEADFVVVATGGRPNTSLISNSGHSNALNDVGAIRVDPATLRLTEPALGFYFAYGDCCDAPGPKTFVSMKGQAPVVAAQVASLVAGKGKASKPTWKEPPQIMMVSFGPKDGQGVLFGWTVPAWFVALVKSRELFVSSWKQEYLGKA